MITLASNLVHRIMNNSKRILLQQIEDVWERNPDLRFCQLIGNCFSFGDNYYRKDDLLSERLKRTYGVEKE